MGMRLSGLAVRRSIRPHGFVHADVQCVGLVIPPAACEVIYG